MASWLHAAWSQNHSGLWKYSQDLPVSSGKTQKQNTYEKSTRCGTMHRSCTQHCLQYVEEGSCIIDSFACGTTRITCQQYAKWKSWRHCLAQAGNQQTNCPHACKKKHTYRHQNATLPRGRVPSVSRHPSTMTPQWQKSHLCPYTSCPLTSHSTCNLHNCMSSEQETKVCIGHQCLPDRRLLSSMSCVASASAGSTMVMRSPTPPLYGLNT